MIKTSTLSMIFTILVSFSQDNALSGPLRSKKFQTTLILVFEHIELEPVAIQKKMN